jgi:Polyketide cyclase / dehydrase and lipid transport/Domain of unknown function (DUF4331)
VVHRASVAGLGDSARFQTSGTEIRFSFTFDVLEEGTPGQRPVQHGTCMLPGGQTLRFTVNDEKGASTPDGTFRVFAGLRSDPFILGWLFVRGLKKSQNLLLHDNVLCMVIEFDTQRILDPDQGSLFGVIAETVPKARMNQFVGSQPPRIDWIGRPEQTNMLLDNKGMGDVDDVRDLWNQQTPFALAQEVRPLFLQRLRDSLTEWDTRDGQQDWPPSAVAAHANVRLDDYMLFDVAKPITDLSHLEIERSTLNGRAYETGGGRTVDANVIDILTTWIVNRDREPLRGGATEATKPGTKSFPYFATPNTDLQSVTDRIELNAPTDQLWELVGQFGGKWHPLIASISVIGTGIGQLRIIETIDGKRIIERLDELDNSARRYSYSNIAGIPASNYTGTFEVKPSPTGSSVEWSAQFLADGQGTLVVKAIVSTLFRTGLESLKSRLGAAK